MSGKSAQLWHSLLEEAAIKTQKINKDSKSNHPLSTKKIISTTNKGDNVLCYIHTYR